MPSQKRAAQLSLVRGRAARPPKLDLGNGGKTTEQGLAKLTLTLMELIRQTLERQALRRVESGTLTEDEVERMGRAFMSLRQKLFEMSSSFGIPPGELSTQLGALIKTGNSALDSLSLVDVLDRLLKEEVVIAGQVRVSVGDVDLIGLDLLAMLYPVYGERRWLDGRRVRTRG